MGRELNEFSSQGSSTRVLLPREITLLLALKREIGRLTGKFEDAQAEIGTWKIKYEILMSENKASKKMCE